MTQATLDFTRKPAPYRGGAWHRKAPSKGHVLRTIFSDGRLHGQRELTQAVGHRFGAVLFVLHRDAEPFHYERVTDLEDDSVVFYRQCTPDRCAICIAPPRRSLRAQIRMLEDIVKAQAERIAELEAER